MAPALIHGFKELRICWRAGSREPRARGSSRQRTGIQSIRASPWRDVEALMAETFRRQGCSSVPRLIECDRGCREAGCRTLALGPARASRSLAGADPLRPFAGPRGLDD